MNVNATPAGLGIARDRGVAGRIETAEGVYGRSKLSAHTGLNQTCMLGETIQLCRKSGPPHLRGGWGGLLAPGMSCSMARGSSWVTLLVSEGRREPEPGWFIVGRKNNES